MLFIIKSVIIYFQQGLGSHAHMMTLTIILYMCQLCYSHMLNIVQLLNFRPFVALVGALVGGLVGALGHAGMKE